MDDPTDRSQRLDTLIGEALAAILHIVRAAPPTPRARELSAQARSYDQAVKHWITVPPHKRQIDAMFDLVTELYAQAVALKAKKRRASGSGEV